ncbi:MAG: hypothetical protein ACKOW2_09045 [Sphingobacteriaceae bacterium]
MKLIHSFSKVLPRVMASIFLLLLKTIAIAQDSTYNSGKSVSNSAVKWYNEGWVWFVIIILAIILVMALGRKNKGTANRDHNKYKEKR